MHDDQMDPAQAAAAELELQPAGSRGETAADPDLPMFYKRPELLDALAHANWRIRPEGVVFAAGVNSVPLMASELVAAARHYPVVFVGAECMPVAVLGLGEHNSFITDGVWRAGVYVPAYVRRYPFVFAELPGTGGHALAIDVEAPMVVRDGEEGVPLFEDGKPSELTRQALRFCDAYTREYDATRTFVAMLVEQGLLVDRSANITLPGGAQSTLAGFSVASAEQFSALSEPLVVEWHRNGGLELVHAHLNSLSRFVDLLGV